MPLRKELRERGGRQRERASERPADYSGRRTQRKKHKGEGLGTYNLSLLAQLTTLGATVLFSIQDTPGVLPASGLRGVGVPHTAYEGMNSQAVIL